MQRRAFSLFAVLTSTAALSMACNDLGSCDDPARGRTTVVNAAGELMFTGQAIINKACLPCHASQAKGTSRLGAPEGLNFDLYPLQGTQVVSAAGGGVQGVALDPVALKGLRTRQRQVYEERELIWEQVEKGLMPPKSASAFKSLVGLFKSAFNPADMKCARGEALASVDASREDFRNWLACDTPIIEATSDQLPYKPVAAGASPADLAAGAGYYSIPGQSVGYQYPSCGSGGGNGGAPSFARIYTEILMPNCAVCHVQGGVNSTVDFGSESAAYTSLLGANGMGRAQSCAMNTSPYVTPGDPSKSYLLNKMDNTSSSAQRCGDLMPQGSGATPSQVALVRSWIMAGAPRTAP